MIISRLATVTGTVDYDAIDADPIVHVFFYGNFHENCSYVVAVDDNDRADWQAGVRPVLWPLPYRFLYLYSCFKRGLFGRNFTQFVVGFLVNHRQNRLCEPHDWRMASSRAQRPLICWNRRHVDRQVEAFS